MLYIRHPSCLENLCEFKEQTITTNKGSFNFIKIGNIGIIVINLIITTGVKQIILQNSQYPSWFNPKTSCAISICSTDSGIQLVEATLNNNYLMAWGTCSSGSGCGIVVLTN